MKLKNVLLMKNIKLILFVVILFGFSLPKGYSQSICLPSGGNFSSLTGSMSWSVGQLVTNSYLGSNAKINNGIQQPYDYIIETELNNLSAEDMIKVYPNPTSKWCVLKIENLDADYSYRLYDLNGELLKCDTICSTTTSINICRSSYALIVVYKGETIIKSLKIIHK